MSPASGPQPAPVRVNAAYASGLAERLSERDWQIVWAINRLRVMSGTQIERLCFVDLAAGRSRIVSRSRVLARLVRWRVLVPLGRRVGGSRRGSSVRLYALDTAGTRLVAGRQLGDGARVRVRRPGTPGERTVRHTVGVSELYVSLVELARVHGFGVRTFETEPGAYWPDGLGGNLKPDAYGVLTLGTVEDHWWIEHDEATESLPTVERKLETYLGFWQRGGQGPQDVVPRVLVSAVTEQRAQALARMLGRLSPPMRDLVTVTTSGRAAVQMYEVLRE
jgi:hypothetical protein